MTSLTSMCELACQIVQKKLEEKQLEEEQAAKAQNWKLPISYDDDNDEESSNSLADNIISELPPCVAITTTKPVDSLSMRDEHLDTISATKSDEFIKSSVENLVPNPSESEGENKCDVPTGFTTFSNVLFDTEDNFDSKIIPMKIDPHSFNAESDLIESMPNHDCSIIISSKIDSLFDEFAGELTLLKSIPLGDDCHPEEETHFTKRLLNDNLSPRPSEEFVSKNSNADIESFSPSPIPIKDSERKQEKDKIESKPDKNGKREIRLIEKLLYDNSSLRPLEEFISKNSNAVIESFSPSLILVEDSNSLRDEIDLSLTLDDAMPSGIEDDDYDYEGDILILEELLSNDSILLPQNESFHFDIPSSPCPLAKPPDNDKIEPNSGILTVEVGENECDVPAGFTTFSNVLFDAEYDFESSDDQSFSDDDLLEKIYSNPLFDEEIIPMKINRHSFNDESDLIESMPNHDSSIIISSKIDSLFDEFVGELTLLKSIPPGVDCHPEEET
uniref:Reverse transcriptase domain-containing protein n=1 Tax=Tanacetum cinerariifolium TaxID=118510 RepID=A0A6L2NNF9_TANCI|nr:hypothetical protein [Tanacetum cinerariifolium]